jgi:glycosyltransferase involved in cell wall biosynthesis
LPIPISVVIATYNRSNVLRLAIETVRWQTLRDWELWVIGDACTDDTETVVASFEDPRIRFVNLAENVGEQSGPNNEGVRRSRGRYIAFLNHDDLWLPDHLARCMEDIEASGADLVYTLNDVVKKRNGRWQPHRTAAAGPGLGYDPRIQVPASCWFFRRELVETVGPWRFYQQSHLIPSQDWLFRAWKARKALRLVPRLTVVCFPSGRRRNSYAERQENEQQAYLERIRNEPDFRERELADMVVGYRMHWLDFQAPEDLISQAFRNVRAKLLLKLKIHPQASANFFRFFRKGAYLDMLRQIRGLPPLQRSASSSKPKVKADR